MLQDLYKICGSRLKGNVGASAHLMPTPLLVQSPVLHVGCAEALAQIAEVGKAADVTVM